MKKNTHRGNEINWWDVVKGASGFALNAGRKRFYLGDYAPSFVPFAL